MVWLSAGAASATAAQAADGRKLRLGRIIREAKVLPNRVLGNPVLRPDPDALDLVAAHHLIDGVPADYRLSIDRDCSRFKRTYALRTECERYNSRFKASGQERLWVRNGKSAANLNTLAHIAALAVALAAVQSCPRHSYRAAKALRRMA